MKMTLKEWRELKSIRREIVLQINLELFRSSYDIPLPSPLHCNLIEEINIMVKSGMFRGVFDGEISDKRQKSSAEWLLKNRPDIVEDIREFDRKNRK